MRWLSILLCLALTGCAPVNTNKDEYNSTDDLTKRIDAGLYYIRQATLSGVLESRAELLQKWPAEAARVCFGSGYRKVVYLDGENTVDTLTYAFPMAVEGSYRVPLVEGIIHCNNSPLSTEQADEVLVREMYAEKKKT